MRIKKFMSLKILTYIFASLLNPALLNLDYLYSLRNLVQVMVSTVAWYKIIKTTSEKCKHVFLRHYFIRATCKVKPKFASNL